MGEIYHTDHLGSSTYLTDNFGRPSHYYETLPFGEMMVEHNQSANVPSGVGYDNKWKFNGKELDDATGMYYYGARYYDPRISIFVSVDPLAEDFVGWTPYHYVHQNPINLIDPTGMEADGWGKRGNTWTYSETLTADNYQDRGYEDYMESGNIFSKTNGFADGEYNYSLNKDGSVSDNNGYNMRGSFSTLRGTTIKPKDVKPFWSTFYTNSGFRKGVNWFKNNDFAGGLGGYFIYGSGGYNMGGKADIKGRHKAIHFDDFLKPNGGGAKTSAYFFEFLRFLSGGFNAGADAGGRFSNSQNQGTETTGMDSLFHTEFKPIGFGGVYPKIDSVRVIVPTNSRRIQDLEHRNSFVRKLHDWSKDTNE